MAREKRQYRNDLLSYRRTSKTSNKETKQNDTICSKWMKKHRKQANKLNNNTKEKDKVYKKPVEEMHVDQKNVW